MPNLIFRQVSIVGHRTFSKVGQAVCAQFVADRRINLDSLFANRWKIDETEEAYASFDRQKTGKGVFVEFD